MPLSSLALPSQKFGAGAQGQQACCKSRGPGWLVPVPLVCSCVLVCIGTFTFFFFFFPLAHSCPTSLGASEATGREMPAVWQGVFFTSWCVFPQPEGELRSNKGQ